MLTKERCKFLGCVCEWECGKGVEKPEGVHGNVYTSEDEYESNNRKKTISRNTSKRRLVTVVE